MSTAKYFAHPTAVVDEGADIGEGTRIWHFCHVMPGARIGPRCSFGQNCYVGSIRAPGITWQKCQIRVPSPMSAPSSMIALAWAKYFVVDMEPL